MTTSKDKIVWNFAYFSKKFHSILFWRPWATRKNLCTLQSFPLLSLSLNNIRSFCSRLLAEYFFHLIILFEFFGKYVRQHEDNSRCSAWWFIITTSQSVAGRYQRHIAIGTKWHSFVPTSVCRRWRLAIICEVIIMNQLARYLVLLWWLNG